MTSRLKLTEQVIRDMRVREKMGEQTSNAQHSTPNIEVRNSLASIGDGPSAPIFERQMKNGELF